MTERELLAAEHALRLLEGEQLMEARRLAGSDPDFAAEVAWWEKRFAALIDEIGEERPSPELWERIQRAVQDGSGDASLVRLRRKLRTWRILASTAAAAAAALLVLQVTPTMRQPAPAPAPAQPVPAPLLVASLSSDTGPAALTVALRPDARELVIAPAELDPAAGRDRELWLIPEGAQPISLGLVAPGGVQRRSLPPVLASRFAEGATIALSDEPTGGSPTGQPTGEVLAAGSLATI